MHYHTEAEGDTGKTHIALGLGLATCQKGLTAGFITAAALVHELMGAGDEKRLLRPTDGPCSRPAVARSRRFRKSVGSTTATSAIAETTDDERVVS